MVIMVACDLLPTCFATWIRIGTNYSTMSATHAPLLPKFPAFDILSAVLKAILGRCRQLSSVSTTLPIRRCDSSLVLPNYFHQQRSRSQL